MSPIEIRVHGVGDHGPLSALGSVGLEPAAQTVKGIESYRKPKLPAHDLVLVNWSRTSRGVAGFLWYLAIPFTLLNVVGYMKPAGGRRAWYTSVTRVAGVLATVVLTAWLIVIAETVLEYVPGLADRTLLAEALSAWVPAAAVAVAILCRTWLRPARRIPPVLACVHALFALLVAVVVFVCKPAQMERTGWPNSFGYGGDVPGAALGASPDPRADAMMFFVLGSTLVAVALASALWNSAAAVVTMLVFLVLHATGAILRLGAEWLMAYLEYIGAVADRTSGMAPSAHVLRAADPEGDRVLLLDLVPIVACAAVVGFTVAFAIAACTPQWKEAREPARPPAYRRRRFVHLVITALAQVIRRALIWTVAIYTALAIGIGVVALNTSWSGWPLTVALILTHTIVAGVLVFIAMRGKVSTAPMILGTVADVAGFWPVRYHPLAGSSYRDEVVGGLRDALERHRKGAVVLFAHSQGSVLGAWLLANETVPENLQDDATLITAEGPSLLPPKEHLYLLTCGSPLKSLYRGFFPSYFHDRFFLRASERTAGWFNAWRETDQIATAMPDVVSGQVHDEEIAEVDPVLLRVHSDYWIEEAPTAWIQQRLTPPGATTP
ncbi:hypothetical protein [Streptomyces rubiginosohelvolus]|uniref:hypothetical protein n=1 Tax=Streptomyces rubiginosohelvolus TaxID=67362 RepID=UPI0036C44A14